MQETARTAVEMPRATETFHFTSRLNLTTLTGRQARDLPELLENIKTAPGSVIYHHTHRFLQQHQTLTPEPPNDFAFWVSHILQETVLGEQLASIDVIQYPTIRALQQKLIETIEHYMEVHPDFRIAPSGEEFNFMGSITFVLPTPHQANTLQEFIEALQKISIHSIYFHMFEARLRIGRPTNDFSLWLENSLGEKKLAQEIAHMDPYTNTLDGLRHRISRLINKRLEETAYAHHQ